MDIKIAFIFIIIVNYVNCAGLLRTPKVYNAIITTDENLTPSRAFPVIQPTIHETGIATYPFGPFNPYRFYNPAIVHYAPPPNIPHPFIPTELQLPFPQSPPQNIEPESNPEQRMLPPELDEMRQVQPQSNNLPPQPQSPQPPQPPQPPQLPQQEQPSSNNQVQLTNTEEKAPIPLNEFGLPPSLVPLQSNPPYQNPIKLQPYTYNHYPLIYEPSVRFADHYLPHYGYYPPHTYSLRPLPKKPQNSAPSTGFRQINNQAPSIPSTPSLSSPSSSSSSSSSDKVSSSNESDLNNIKNGTANKNSEVPDVPPPPVPSGAKTPK